VRLPRHGLERRRTWAPRARSRGQRPSNEPSHLPRPDEPAARPFETSRADWAFSHRDRRITPRMGSNDPMACRPSRRARAPSPQILASCHANEPRCRIPLRARYDPCTTRARERTRPHVPFRTNPAGAVQTNPSRCMPQRSGRPDARLVSTPTTGPYASFQTNPAARRSPKFASCPSEQTRPRFPGRTRPWYAVRRRRREGAKPGARPNEPGHGRSAERTPAARTATKPGGTGP
jgi:hypothetical protein